jgi:hypothetical protein
MPRQKLNGSELSSEILGRRTDMGSRWGVIVLAAALIPCAAPAVEVSLAPLEVVDETGASPPLRPGADLGRTLAGMGAGGILDLRPMEEDPTVEVRSLLDASRLCRSSGYPLLLYGFVRRTALSFAAEIKLYDAEKGAVAASFFASDDTGHYDRFMKDLATRILDYFAAGTPHGATTVTRDPERNLVGVPISLGYWTPAGGGWNQLLAGLGSATLGFRFVPSRPLFTFLSRQWIVGFGVDAEYGLGMSQPGFESSFLHTVHVRIPVECGVELARGHSIGMNVGALLSVDILSQDRLYSSPYVGATSAAGITAAALYRYEASNLVTIGCSMVFDVAFYAIPLVTISPRLFLELTPGRAAPGGQP